MKNTDNNNHCEVTCLNRPIDVVFEVTRIVVFYYPKPVGCVVMYFGYLC